MKSVNLACVFLIAPLGLFPVAANASFYTGDDLYAACMTERGSNTYVEKSYECIAYITGAVDAFNTTRKTNKLDSCLPADVTIGQLKEVTMDYLARNPNDRKGSASEQVFKATRKAWPCASSTKSAPQKSTGKKSTGKKSTGKKTTTKKNR
jgi:hypothetical protein